MSTRSYILVETAKGEYKGIYCHSDGYLTYNGAMLVDHYKDREKVEQLISLGNISCLAERIAPNPAYEHSFDYGKRQAGVVVAYARDRGEVNQQAQNVRLQQLATDPWIEYTYVYRLDNKWYYFEDNNCKSESDLIDLEQALDKMFKEWGVERPVGLYGFFNESAIAIIKEEQEKAKQPKKDAKYKVADIIK